MNRKGWTILGLLALGIIITGRLCWPSSPEPTWNGRPVSAWIEDLQQSQGGSGPLYMGGILHIGPKAVPYLVRELKKRDSIFANLWLRYWWRFPVWVQRKLGVPKSPGQTRWTATSALAALGPFAS